jgi:hypothetical protein
MKRLIYLLILGGIIYSCDSDTTNTNDNTNQTVNTDTITSYYGITDHKVELEKKDTVLVIDNEKFTLSYTAKIEPLKLFPFTDIYSDKERNYKDIYRGLNATYTISLADSLGKSIFSTTLTKDNFIEIFDGSILAPSDSRLPNFIGYLNNFNSFFFTIGFSVPQSDVGGQCCFMINKNGDITENFLNNYWGGADCDGEIGIPTNENFILTCRKILNTNGKNIETSDKRFRQVGTKLINDNTILVIQDYNDTTNSQNAKLIDNFGKTLKTFTYLGYYSVLGYIVPMYFDYRNNNFILFDDEQMNLRVINKDQPLSTYTVDFSKMKPFNNDKQESEVVFNIDTEVSNNTFTFDSLTNAFRYKKNQYNSNP